MADVAVIGGGPAGATAGRLLAEWGHRVTLLDRPAPRHSLAESLPPSARKVLAHVGILERVERGGFLAATGNTSWWGGPAGRAQTFPEPSGFQVLRRDFDRLLLEAAGQKGVQLRRDVTVRRAELDRGDGVVLEHAGRDRTAARLQARFVLDCSGRAGVIARRFRVKDERLTTVALSGVWRNPDGFGDVVERHTLVEAYPDGWAWSVPLSRELRHVAVMVDPRTRGPSGTGARYRAELARTVRFRRLVEDATLSEAPWACAASVYGARAFGGERFLLVGDAASFLDPMSSFGVKKALTSGWMAAVVANTCLSRPERAAAALELFSRSEREMAASSERESFRFVREAAARHPTPFWQRRAEAAPRDGAEDAPDAAVRASFERLKRTRRLRLRPGAAIRPALVAEVQGREVVLAEALATPALPAGVRHVRGVLVPALLRVASSHADVPSLYEAYSRAGPAVPLPDFVAALSVALAKGVLERR